MLTAADRERIRGLLVAAADGDRASLEPLFAVLWPSTLAYCRQVLRGDAMADDAAQDTMIAVFRRMSEYDAERDPLAWVLGIATWQCRTLARRRWRRAEVPAEGTPVAVLDGVDEFMRRDVIRAALATIATLSPADIATLTASILDEDGRPGMTGATFRKRLERARQRLRTAWRSRHGTS